MTLPLIKDEDNIPYNNFELIHDNDRYHDSFERKIALGKDFRTQQQAALNSTTVLALSKGTVLSGFEPFFNNEIRLMNGEDSALAMARALHLKPDLVILHDAAYGDISAQQVAKTLKSHEITRNIPLVWISSENRLEEADLNIDASTPSSEIYTKIGDLMSLRQKLIKELIGDSAGSSSKPKYQNNKEAFLTRLERIVDAHLSRDDLDMEKLSTMLYLNRSQIHRRIKAYTGMNTTEYIRHYKLKLAYRDLEQQTGTVAEIAYRCGFNSPSYFSKSFKEAFGISPSSLVHNQALNNEN
jgi:AraC-like DNA-binding protein